MTDTLHENAVEICVSKVHEVCRALFGIVVSRRKAGLRGGGDVLKTDLHAFTYRPDLDAIEEAVVKVLSERSEPPLTAESNESSPQKRRRCVYDDDREAVDLRERAAVADAAVPQDETDDDFLDTVSDKVQLVIEGGNLSELFLPFKGGQELERGSRRWGSTFDERALDIGWGVGSDVGEGGLCEPMQRSIEWKRDLVRQATDKSDEDRHCYNRQVLENMRLQDLRWKFQAALDGKRHNKGSPAGGLERASGSAKTFLPQLRQRRTLKCWTLLTTRDHKRSRERRVS